MSKVAVVILNYNLQELVIKSVNSVLKSSYKDIQVIVVDNSEDNLLEKKISQISSEIIYVDSGGNLGYTGGNNLGIKKALELGAGYVFILNPDAFVEQFTIERLIEGLEKHGASIVGPKIFFDGSKKIWFAGGKFDSSNVLGSHIGVDLMDSKEFSEDKLVDFVTGAAILIKKEVFLKIGFFDERYFLYYEDLDFCYRAKMAGFKIYFIASALAYHKNAQSTGLGSSIQDYYITRNRMLFALKFLSKRTQFALLREGLRNLSKKSRRLALLDFLLQKFGKGSI